MKAIVALGFLWCGAALGDGLKWVDWSDGHFSRAKKEHRLVVLDLHAVWCHWCHVMEETTYADPRVQSILKSKFITVSVDQDARPDISSRYQDYGWPATVIFNGEGKEIAKLSGFIPADKFVGILENAVAHPNDVAADADEGAGESKTPVSLEVAALRKQIVSLVETEYDTKKGSWDRRNKFLDVGLVEFLLFGQRNEKWAKQTLGAQVALLDPAWGGVYQYSTGSDWNAPHFEKIMSFQTSNIRAYCMAASGLRDPGPIQTAMKIRGYLNRFMRSPQGAYYTSQDNIYARENGWVIRALVDLYAVSGDRAVLEEATVAAKWILKHRAMASKKGGFTHGERDRGGPFLGDALAMGEAMLGLYSATGDRIWLEKSFETARFVAGTFRRAKSGFISAKSQSKILISVVDPSENIQLGRYFNLLSHYTGKPLLREAAEHAMKAVANSEVAGNVYAAPELYLFSKELEQKPLHVTIVGHRDDSGAQALMKVAMGFPSNYRRLDVWDKREGALMNPDVKYPELSKAAAFVCANKRCGMPAFTPDDLMKQLRSIDK